MVHPRPGACQGHAERATFADEDVREQARAFHSDPAPPVVRHLIAEPVPRER